MKWSNLHAHNMWSFYDGFGEAKNHVARAKELGQEALAVTNHGNCSGWVEHFYACKDADIKPILGVEAYFQPVFKPKDNRHHLILLAQNNVGLHNLMKLTSESNRDRFYSNPFCDFESLDRYKEGLIVLSGCISGAISKQILGGHRSKAVRLAKAFKKIFGDRFYFEVQANDMEAQFLTNKGLLSMSEELDIPVVLTADSHYMAPEDYDTYMVMHAIASNRKPEADYSKLYIASEDEMKERWYECMGQHNDEIFEEAGKIVDRCNAELTSKEEVPKIDWGMPSKKKLTDLAVKGLGKLVQKDSRYRTRLQHEVKVVLDKGFEDYFLLCYDIVEYARSKDISTGFGRGSVCGSLLAYSLGLTNVDPILMGTSFERFLRPDKVTMPDIDIDFDSKRRDEIVDYVLKRYPGKAAPMSAFGYYRDANLSADLAKMYGDIDKDELEGIRAELSDTDYDTLMQNPKLRRLNKTHKGFVKHFAKLRGQVRFIGRHASGIAVSGTDIDSDAGVFRIRGEYRTTFDLASLERLGIVKMDLLSLDAVTVVKSVEDLTGAKFSMDKIKDDKAIYDAFCAGDTDGIFQFEKYGAKKILGQVQPRNIGELIACNALNRPAPIQLGIVDEYIDAKNGNESDSIWSDYTRDTFGTIVYQEHVMAICHDMAGMEWPDVDKVMKGLRQTANVGRDPLKEKFVKGAVRLAGASKKEAADLYNKMTLYLFGKGHSTGYTMMSAYFMWLRLNYPFEFWSAMIRGTDDEYKQRAYKATAVKAGVVVLLPHVNGTAECSIAEIDGERAVQEGLVSIKGIGVKVADEIMSRAPFEDEEDFLDRVPKKFANVGVVNKLRDSGALQFNMKIYYRGVKQYNATLWAQSARKW